MDSGFCGIIQGMSRAYNKKRVIVFGAVAVAWLCFIWGHSLQPAVVSSGESGFFLRLLNSLLPVELSEFIVRKTAHFTEDVILGILLALELSGWVKKVLSKLIYPLFAGLMVAMCDETIQMFVEGRSCEVRDVWIDFAGIFFATVVTCVIIERKRLRLDNNRENLHKNYN